MLLFRLLKLFDVVFDGRKSELSIVKPSFFLTHITQRKINFQTSKNAWHRAGSASRRICSGMNPPPGITEDLLLREYSAISKP